MNLITFSAPTHLGYGEEVTYDNEGGQSIGGLTDGATYAVIVLDDDTIALADSSDDADRAQKQCWIGCIGSQVKLNSANHIHARSTDNQNRLI